MDVGSNREPPPSPPSGHIDDLFDYDVGLDDILQEAPLNPDANASKPSTAPDASGLGLGLDEEVKVSKKRQPVAKLDESRLLSQPGIPKLRHAAKSKLRFKGKGHEFSDAARLLNFYQLWLDDLFPRAKFADGLTMIEKLGHTKRLQTMRREWIEEEKPRAQTGDNEDTVQRNPATGQQSHNTTTNDFDDFSSANAETLRPTGMDHGLTGGNHVLSENHSAPGRQTGEQSPTDQELFMSDDDDTPAAEQDAPEDDELDALLREQEDEVLGTGKSSTMPASRHDGDDDLEAMHDLEAFGTIFP